MYYRYMVNGKELKMIESLKVVIKQLLCRHQYHRVANYFDVERWETRRQYRCPCCDKVKLGIWVSNEKPSI
jgi:hypothetical protein